MADLSRLPVDLVHKAIQGTFIRPQRYVFRGADDVDLVCSIAGSGSLIIAHSPGWGCGMGYMEKYWTPLAQKHTLLVICSRGTAPSYQPKDATKMGSADMAEDVEALRVLLKLDTIFAIVGHSNGSAVVQYYASKYTSRVERLVLLCSQLIGSSAREDVRLKVFNERKGNPLYKEYVPGMAKAYAATTQEDLTDGIATFMPVYFAHPDSDIAREWQALIRKGGVQIWPWQTQKSVDNTAAGPDLEAIKAKTLVVLGDEDPVATEVWSRELHERIYGSEYVIFKDSGHMPWHEADDFWPTLLDFLGK